MNHMKNCNAIQCGYYLVLISCECEFTMDWVQYVGDIIVGDLRNVGKKIIVVCYEML